MKHYECAILAIGGCFLIPQTAFSGQLSTTSTITDGANKPYVSLADTSRIFNLDEVVVVTQPKENAILRHQPLASNIFTSTETNKLGIRDISELSAYVPSFTMPSYGSRLTSSMYVRGIGSRVNNPAVGIYMDGMPLLSKSAFNYHFYQIDRADVLRGPQGTLYGMNTEGGLVRLYSKNPLTNKGTEIRLGIGNHFYRNAEASSYFKLSHNTAMSVAAFYNGSNGFFRNAYTGKRADNYDEAGGKIRIVNQYSNKLTYDFTADYQYANQCAFPYGELDLTSNTTASPATNRHSGYRRNMLNTAFNIRYALQNVTFNSTTSYQFLSDRMDMDQDYTSRDYMHLMQKQLQNGITQEFAIKGKSGKWKHTNGIFGSFQWQRTDAPVFFDNDFTARIAGTIQSSMYNAIEKSMAEKFMSIPDMTTERANAMAEQAIAKAGGVSVEQLSMDVPGIFHTPQFNFGAFHESTLDITKRLSMTIGLRYDYSHTKIDYSTRAVMDVAVNVMSVKASSRLRSILSNSKCNSFNQVLPKLGFTWKLDANGSNAYALTSKGYRSGGFNIQMFSDILQAELRANSNAAMRTDYDIPHTSEDYAKINSTISYKPEYSWNYEAGTHLNLFKNSIQADFAVYYMKIRNQQLSVMAGTYGFGRMMVNAGRSHSCGLEASLRGKAFDNDLSWSVTYSYTRSVFDKYDEQLQDGTSVDYADNYVPFIPQHTLSVAADWTIPFHGNTVKAIVLGANTTAQGKTYWDEANSFSQGFHALLGAHADITMGNATLSIWSKNITSTKYNVFAFSSNATGNKKYLAQRGAPFQIGLDLNFRL